MLLSNDEAEEILNAAQTVILCANHQRKLCSDILTLRLVPCGFIGRAPLILTECEQTGCKPVEYFPGQN